MLGFQQGIYQKIVVPMRMCKTYVSLLVEIFIRCPHAMIILLFLVVIVKVFFLLIVIERYIFYIHLGYRYAIILVGNNLSQKNILRKNRVLLKTL